MNTNMLSNNYWLPRTVSRHSLHSSLIVGIWVFPFDRIYRLGNMLRRNRFRIPGTSFLISTFIGLFFLLSANFCVAQSPPVSYKVIITVDIETELNRYGQDGWRFKSIMPWECQNAPIPGRSPTTYRCSLLILEK